MALPTEDPLLALRHAIQSNASISFSIDSDPSPSLLAATHIILSPTLSFPKQIQTRFKSAANNVYSLEAVYLAWKLKDAAGTEYMRQARENGLTLGFVSVTERKGVVDWLEGRLQNSERIVPLAVESTTPPGTPPQASSSLPGGVTAGSSKSNLDVLSSSPSKRRYVVDAEDAEVVKKIKQNEIELRDRNTVLRGTKPNNFSAIRQVYLEKLKKLKDPVKPANSGSTSSNGTSLSDPNSAMLKSGAKKARNQYPIIMISSSPTALITMYNVKKFLSESIFEPSSVARENGNNTRPEDLIALYRRRVTIEPGSGREIETQMRYFVVDGTEALSKFGADAWERVVCVMTTGQVWQFKPYKWNEPRTLFHHVKGIYVAWQSEPPNPKIRDWNVEELKIDQHRRHVDKSVVAHFWQTLDNWVLANKPWLMKG